MGPGAPASPRRFLLWMLAAAVAYVAATAALRRQPELPALLPWGLTALAMALAAGAIVAFRRYLRGADELVRKIEIDALAIAFGAGALFTMLYPLCERLGAPRLGLADAALVLMFAWMAGAWIGWRRYRGGSGE